MSTDLAAVLIGPLLVIELQLFGCAAMVVPYRLCLFCSRLIQQLWKYHNTHMTQVQEYGFPNYNISDLHML